VPAKKRSKIQQLRDRATIAELYLKGWSQIGIGEFLELNQSNISRELTKIKAGWKAETNRDYDLVVEEQLNRLSMIECEYWDGWQRSQVIKEQTMQERMNEAVESSKAKVQRRTETRVGDPRFLEGIIKCVQERGKLLDLYPSHSDRSETISGNAPPGLSVDAVQLIRAQILGVSTDAG
jgi:hypothetical protein